MDRISATNYGTHNGNLNVVGMNLLSDSTKDVTEIYFAQSNLQGDAVDSTKLYDIYAKNFKGETIKINSLLK